MVSLERNKSLLKMAKDTRHTKIEGIRALSKGEVRDPSCAGEVEIQVQGQGPFVSETQLQFCP